MLIGMNITKSGEVKEKEKRWVQAPTSDNPCSPVVFGVWLEPDEDVRWLWTYTAEGSYVSGYQIKERLD